MSRDSAMRRRRLERGLTQAELAEQAGVSRQLVAAVEGGRNAPAVDAALGLASALATTVEELFAAPLNEVLPALGGRLRDRVPLRVGRVGDQLVGAELPDHGIAEASWARPDAISDAGKVRLLPAASPAGVVLAGCEPAFGLAERMLDGLGPRSLLAISAPTDIALAALREGRIHAAVVHGLARHLPAQPVQLARWHVARWQVGVAVASRLSDPSLESVLASGMPVAQREHTAASQQAFERARRAAGIRARPAGPTGTGHLDAARLAATLGGAAVTNETAARAFGLRFFTLEEHAVELWVADRWLEHSGVHALVELLRSKAFTERLAQYGGYDLTRSGDRIH